MVVSTSRLGLAGRIGDDRVGLATFAATLFLSALLLFSVQPMFAKLVLPQLGGAPSVWAVSLCFFQATLLAGYCYAHALNRYVPWRWAPLVHLSLLSIAWLSLPVGLPAGHAEPPADGAYLWLVVTLAKGVGLPFFAISASAPLLQAWFAASGNVHSRDPYFLYGASNLGSLLALLAYPILVEPALGLGAQARLWTGSFLILGLMILASALLMLASRQRGAGRAEARMIATPAMPVTGAERLAWIGFAAVPSGLLVAFTSFVTTDIASAPFLWVLPLAIFLATFVLVFRAGSERLHRAMLLTQPALVALVLLGLSARGNTGWMIGSIAGLAAFFVTTMVAHRALYASRPAPEHLTEFYLWMSLGGVIGGVFAALIAPQVFNNIYEYPLLLIAGMACRPGVLGAEARRHWRELAPAGAAVLLGLLVTGLLMRRGTLPPTETIALLALIAGGAMLLLNRGRPARELAGVTLMGAALVLVPSAFVQGDAVRSFFGVHRVSTIDNGRIRVLLHGTTLHGVERIKTAEGLPTPAPVPAIYYYAGGPMARGVDVGRLAAHAAGRPFRAGVVGLGSGAMACHSRPDEAWRFFEIDPVVVDIARDARRFRFMSHCRPMADIVLGDARLTLAKEPAGGLDYLVIDAFASDAVPVHLLTAEAIGLYLSRLAPDGLLAMHVSNRHLDLIAVAGAAAHAVPGTLAAVVEHQPATATLDTSKSQVVLLSRSPATMARVLAWPDARPLGKGSLAAWTDDYSDILGALWRKYTGPRTP